MAQVKIEVPAMGEGITEATITKLLKNVGDAVEVDDPIIEIATDKVDSEIVATHSGTIEKFLFNEGDIAQVGEVVAFLLAKGSDSLNETVQKEIITQNSDKEKKNRAT